jgi:chemotaxis protein MotB
MALRVRTSFNIWPVFTDVMMGLVFILLLVAIAFLADKKEEIIKQEMAARLNLLELELARVEGQGTLFTHSTHNESELLISFKDHVLFESGKFDLKSDGAHNLLLSIGRVLYEYERRYKDRRYHEVVVEGHTDDIPYRTMVMGNWTLSSMRANTVLGVFLEARVDSTLLSPRGYASTRPPEGVSKRAGQYRESDRDLMRRVDIRVRFVKDSVAVEKLGG